MFITKRIKFNVIICKVYDTENDTLTEKGYTLSGSVKTPTETLKKIRKSNPADTIVKIVKVDTIVKTYRCDLDKFLSIAEPIIHKPRFDTVYGTEGVEYITPDEELFPAPEEAPAPKKGKK